MSLPVCSVTCTMHGQDGEPEPGASFEFSLNRYEVYEGFVVPERVSGIADETGSCVIDLWPNQLGTTESVYDVKMRSTTGKTQRITASVPNEAAAFLHDIAMLPPYPGKPDFQTQMDAAIEAKQSAVAAMDTTLEARDVTLAASDVATTQAGISTAQAVIATTQAGIATTKAAEAAASAVTAATFDPALFVPKAGGVTMTGTLAVPAGATGSNVPRASEVVPLAGGVTMTGTLAVPAGATGSNVPRRSEVVGSTGDETIAGIKTFSSAPVVPAGATGSQAPRVSEVVGITSATGSAKGTSGTTAQRDASPVAGYDRFNSTLGTKEFGNGTEWVQVKRQASAVVATTSGTSHVITGIPAYATRVELHLDAVSTTGTQPMLVQAGTSAGVVVTGYAESASYDIFAGTFSGAITAGFPVSINAAATTMRGTVTLFRKPGTNRWECQGMTSRAAGGLVWTTGYIDLPGALDRIALSRSGADDFDAGAVWATWS